MCIRDRSISGSGSGWGGDVKYIHDNVGQSAGGTRSAWMEAAQGVLPDRTTSSAKCHLRDGEVRSPWWDGDIANWVSATGELVIFVLIPFMLGAGNAYYWLFFSARHRYAKGSLGILIASASLLVFTSCVGGIVETLDWINIRLYLGEWPEGKPR